ncbi:hypothetical protein LCGC14_1606270 [marine sediment metagenome]|uniref:Uncharacterized protein n=1 Tax=marine sediment metagenome TaxID=412755 RepID=A0A0F9IA03_9ZZZZ
MTRLRILKIGKTKFEFTEDDFEALKRFAHKVCTGFREEDL